MTTFYKFSVLLEYDDAVNYADEIADSILDLLTERWPDLDIPILVSGPVEVDSDGEESPIEELS